MLLDETDHTNLVSQIYAALCKTMKENTTKIKSEWEKDLGAEMKNEEWDKLWLNLSGSFTTTKAKEIQFRINHRLHITPLKHNKMSYEQSYLSFAISVRLRKVHMPTVYWTVYTFTNSGKMYLKKLMTL